jgi:hypothetical protein
MAVPLLRRKAEARQIRPDNYVTGKATCLSGFPEIGCSQRTTGHLEVTLSRSTD